MKINFIHKWDSTSASYRYRSLIPAREIGASVSASADPSADVFIFTKLQVEEINEATFLSENKKVIVDVCEDWMHYEDVFLNQSSAFPIEKAKTYAAFIRNTFTQMFRIAHGISCSTAELKKLLYINGYTATHINDPYEFDRADPHCSGNKLLWFGHYSNFYSLDRVKDQIVGYPLRIVSNKKCKGITSEVTPWSIDTMLQELAYADIVVVPKTAHFKSANRVVESIRRGCFVVAEPHPSLEGFPGIWIGNIKEGIEWVINNLSEANDRILKAQEYVEIKYSPKTCGDAWLSLCQKVLN
jgi:hypothetical protein